MRTSKLQKKSVVLSLLSILLGVMTLLYAQANSNKAVLLTVAQSINPATADYVVRGIEYAQQQHSPLVILQLDTPGGLDKSMREINRAILASKIPVVVFVSPSGARAASAGTFILYASHLAAMAPGTNIGAASPVSIGGGGMMPTPNKKPDDSSDQTMKNKVTNDVLAYMRSLSQLRNRDAAWGEQAITHAATLSANEALAKNVIDVIADDIPQLLQKINGKTISVHGEKITLNTQHMTVDPISPDWRNLFLSVITDPSVAYVLMLIGIYGLFFEFANPGFVLPGVAGAICLLLAMYALQMLPINFAGLALIVVGIAFMIAEAFIPGVALGIGGAIAFIIGSIMLYDTHLPGYQIAWSLIFSVAIINLAFFTLVLGMALRATRQKVVTGHEALIDQTVTAIEDIEDTGHARVAGEIWLVKTNAPLKKGDHATITRVDGLLLQVDTRKKPD